MKIDLSGKVAVVTGSTAGIGYAVARGLALAGARVTLNGRRQETVDAAVAALRRETGSIDVHGVAADLETAAGCAALVDGMPSADILVNNLGIYRLKDFFETDDAAWSRLFEVNVMSGVRLSRACAPAMVARGWGRIVFVSSESGVSIPVESIHYGLTKTANLSVARGLAKRLAGTGVTVNSVLPGPTLSDGIDRLIHALPWPDDMAPEDRNTAFVLRHRPGSLIRRIATVDEVANLVVYVASPQASATTGAALRVDGGVVDTIV